jgi:hypothetical protein
MSIYFDAIKHKGAAMASGVQSGSQLLFHLFSRLYERALACKAGDYHIDPRPLRVRGMLEHPFGSLRQHDCGRQLRTAVAGVFNPRP